MNLPLWSCIREYIDAEIKLALARRDIGNDPTAYERQRIELLEAQSTRMEAAVRDALPTTGNAHE